MDILVVKGMLLGGFTVGSVVAALFFLRFWKKTSDRLFLYFAFAFFILAINRMLMAIDAVSSDEDPVIYLMRLVAYGLIIFAIMDKNRKKSPSFSPPNEHLQKI
jgi:hypothetical protein